MSLTSSHLLSGGAALAVVLGLVLLFGRSLRAAGLARFGTSPSQFRRLSVLESLSLDRSRRLILVRCDQEDVVLLTGATDLVVARMAGPVQVVGARS